MLRITRNQANEGSIELKLEGRLLEAWISELSSACETVADRRSLRIDLAGLRFADASGVALLRSLAGQGATIVGCSPFIAGLLDLAPDDTAGSSPSVAN